MEKPLIGVGVLIVREGKLLLGKRQGSHGAGCWSTPGGHLEFGEMPAECARREAQEETGLSLRRQLDYGFTSDIFAAEGKHYITLFMLAEAEGEAQLCEPEKCAGWHWFAPHELPDPLFAPLETLRQKKGLAFDFPQSAR